MYRIKDIQEELLHLVGWQQSYDPEKQIDISLTKSDSGLYFNDGSAHPLVTLNNIRAIMPDDFIFQYPVWNSLLSYNVGDKVRHNGVVWIAGEDNNNVEPVASDFNEDYNDDFGNPIWQEYNYLSDYLENLTKSGIAKTIQTFVQYKKLKKETKQLMERKAFFDGAGNIRSTIRGTNLVCGFEISPVRGMGVTTKLEKVGLQFATSGQVTLYLFHSSMSEPVKTFELDYTKENGAMQWFDLSSVFMPYISDSNGAGGSWFICYDQSELPLGMEAVNFARDWSVEPCGTCNGGDTRNWRQMTKYLRLSPFSVEPEEDFSAEPRMWNIERTIHDCLKNYGINCLVSVSCDLTDFIISQKEMFQTVLQRQVAYIALKTMAMNPNTRVNREEVNVDTMTYLYELDGSPNTDKQSGIAYELAMAYKALAFDTKGIDPVCLGCHNGGVRYGTV